MKYKEEMLHMLSEAGEVLLEQIPHQEALESNLMKAWLEQVAAALQAVGMQEELELWNKVRQIAVDIDDKAGFQVYVTSMRAILLGFLSRLSES